MHRKIKTMSRRIRQLEDPLAIAQGSVSSRATEVEATLMHRKIEEMGQRIRQLEDALAILQASMSSERHPLLRDEYKIKFPFERSEDTDAMRSPMAELVDELGTLKISENGHVRYFGRSGGTEVRPIFLIHIKCDSTEWSHRACLRCVLTCHCPHN